MKEISLIFPHQLFENLSLFDHKREVFLVEDFLYFRQYKFHKQKLVLHRASVKCYEDFLKSHDYIVRYIDSEYLQSRQSLWNLLQQEHEKEKISKIYIYELVDYYLEQDIKTFSKKNNITIEIRSTPMFINTSQQNREFFEVKNKGKKPFMKTFYEWQRQRLSLLMKDGKPLGGVYSFDSENRKKLPKNFREPEPLILLENKYVAEARVYVQTNFKNNYGKMDRFIYAVSFDEAKKVFHYFLKEKLKDFGTYEDAISETQNYLYHSLLTPYLNIGLLTPDFIVQETLWYVKRFDHVPLNSLEGFMRQIVGWREFMKAMYDLYGVSMRTENFWKCTNHLPESFWSGETGNFVVDATLQKTIAHAYNHHIERLMILGNYMLLSEYDPDDVYVWFMTMYIDSYDWVMVPNVYGMSQFADGGIFATKPYICASNYIIKMSDYKKDTEKTVANKRWSRDFDEKFWNFLKKHKTFFEKNIRFKMLLSRIKQ